MLRKPCRLQTDGQTDGQGESSIPPSDFVGRGYKNSGFIWDMITQHTPPFASSVA